MILAETGMWVNSDISYDVYNFTMQARMPLKRSRMLAILMRPVLSCPTCSLVISRRMAYVVLLDLFHKL